MITDDVWSQTLMRVKADPIDDIVVGRTPTMVEILNEMLKGFGGFRFLGFLQTHLYLISLVVSIGF